MGLNHNFCSLIGIATASGRKSGLSTTAVPSIFTTTCSIPSGYASLDTDYQSGAGASRTAGCVCGARR